MDRLRTGVLTIANIVVLRVIFATKSCVKVIQRSELCAFGNIKVGRRSNLTMYQLAADNILDKTISLALTTRTPGCAASVLISSGMSSSVNRNGPRWLVQCV